MKALSIIQPWASLIAVGAKRIETRSFSVSYRGPVAIHASKKFGPEEREYTAGSLFMDALLPFYPLKPYPVLFGEEQTPDLPTGCIVGTANLVDCRYMGDDDPADWINSLTRKELAFGNYGAGRYGWFFEDPSILCEPAPAKGALGLWEWNEMEAAK